MLTKVLLLLPKRLRKAPHLIPPPASSDEQITLRFSWWGGDERLAATLAVIDQFQDLHPNITIEAEYGSSDGYHDKLATQLQGGT